MINSNELLYFGVPLFKKNATLKKYYPIIELVTQVTLGYLMNTPHDLSHERRSASIIKHGFSDCPSLKQQLALSSRIKSWKETMSESLIFRLSCY